MEATANVSKKIIECSVVARGSAKPYKPGVHARGIPEWDKDRCIRCGVCYIYCPYGAVNKQEDGFFDVDKDRCCGCGICHRECWFGVIGMVEEE